MANFFTIPEFKFPYKFRFPGQNSSEKILFSVRENKIMLVLRIGFVVMLSLAFFAAGFGLSSFVGKVFGPGVSSAINFFSIILALIFFLVGSWWVKQLWIKSICVVTNKRLVKFVFTTPVSKYTLSLPLDMIVDTGSFTKGFLQTFFKLGTFMARSSASSSGVATDDTSRVNKKYFYIRNVACAEDLQHYVNKLLVVFNKQFDKLDTFRPFIPNLKGDRRKEYMKKYPEYWS